MYSSMYRKRKNRPTIKNIDSNLAAVIERWPAFADHVRQTVLRASVPPAGRDGLAWVDQITHPQEEVAPGDLSENFGQGSGVGECPHWTVWVAPGQQYANDNDRLVCHLRLDQHQQRKITVTRESVETRSWRGYNLEFFSRILE